MPALAERIEQQQPAPIVIAVSAMLNAGKVPAAPVEVDEVDDVAVHDAIDHVAERAAEHQRQADREQRLVGADAPQPDHQHEAHDQRQPDEEPALPAGRLREDAERGAGVLQVHDVENRQQRDRVLHLHGADHQCLGRLVEQHDEERQPQPVAGAARRREPDLRKRIAAHGACVLLDVASLLARPVDVRDATAAQLRMLGVLPTSSRLCQQRTHFFAAVGRATIQAKSSFALLRRSRLRRTAVRRDARAPRT